MQPQEQNPQPRVNPMNMPTKPLYAAPNTGHDNFTRRDIFHAKNYFFKRENGNIFHTDARDAWAILKGRKQRVGYLPERYIYIGCTDGTLYNQAVAESHQIFTEKGLAASQAFLREAYQKEIEEAKNHRDLPPNPDTVDLQGNQFDMNNY